MSIVLNRWTILIALIFGAAGTAHAAAEIESGCRSFITLSPALTVVAQDLLDREELGARLKGVVSYSPLPSGLTITEVAAAGRIDFEKVLALRPDCVFTSPGVFPSALLERLDRTASKASRRIRVIHVAMDSLNQISEGYKTMGIELGTEKRGADLAANFQKRLNKLRGRLKGLRAFIQVDDQPLIAVGGGRTFLSDAFEHLGVENILSRIQEAYPRVSMESVVASSPDRIWILGEPGDPGRYEAMAASWKKRFPALKAVRSHGIRVVLSREMTIPAMSLATELERIVSDETR